MQRINYKSDFDFILRLRDCKGDAVGFPGYDWEVRLWTPQNKANAYTASCRGGVCENCYNDDGEIHIVCDGHRLGLGQLCAELTVELPNGIYPDGYRKRVEPQLLDIELVSDAGDCPTEAQTEVGVAYAVIDAYDMAVASGYEGTREDYTASLGLLPGLAATVSDLRQGKREIARALTEQGIPTAEDAPMAQMAESVRSLYQKPAAGTGGASIRGGIVSRYDMFAEVCSHKRGDYPYSVGYSFEGDEIVLGESDAALLSDGTWLEGGCGGTTHTFTDGELSHYAICYFASDFFAMPWPRNLSEILNIASVDSHPTFSATTSLPFLNLYMSAKPMSYEGYDFSVGDCNSIIAGGISELPSGTPVVSTNAVPTVELPDLRITNRGFGRSTIRYAGFPGLERADSSLLINYQNKRMTFPELVAFNGSRIISESPSLRFACFPKLKRIQGVLLGYNCPNLEEIHLESAEDVPGTILDDHSGADCTCRIFLDSLKELKGYFLRNCWNGNVEYYMPKLVMNTQRCFLNTNSAALRIKIHLGSQEGAYLLFSETTRITELTIEPGFTGSIDFKKAVLSVDNLRNLIANLGDNTGGATHRLQMGADNLAKLTEDEIAVATAKNYTLS